MNILVTGGAGYIGSHMVRMLVARGHTVTILDTMEYGSPQAVPKEAQLVKGNVGDEEALRRIFAERAIAGVIHFAGYISVEESVRDPILYMRNNLIAPITLLEAMKKANVRALIFSSTAAVYGNPTILPIPEDHPKNPVSPYGLSKWCFEELLNVYDRSFGIKSASLRYFNASGASLDGAYGEVHNPETHLIPIACAAALDKISQMRLYGTDYKTEDGTAVRDYIHIEDLCEAHLLVLEALMKSHPSGAYNVGTGKGHSVKSVLDEVKRVSGVNFPVVESARRSGDAAVLVADSTKLMGEFGWKPKHSDLRSIVASAWKWHKSHPKGYAS
jgi:UDP-glucose-4-epimerase GalE